MKDEKKVATLLWNIDTAVSCFCLAVLITLTVAGVLWRYIFNAPFTWLEEVQLALMVWIVFMGGGVAFRYGNQVAIEMVVEMFPKKVQKAIDALISIVVVVTLAYLFVQSIGFVRLFIRSGRATPMLDIPYWLIYGIAPVSYITMTASYFYALIKGVKTEIQEAIEA